MAEDNTLDPQALGSIRSPLITHTNSKPLTKFAQNIRRKSSFARRLDSEESVPSSHGSIFVAEYFSPHGSDDSGYKTEQRQSIGSLKRLSATEERQAPLLGNDENSGGELPIGNTPIIYGHGTALSTIIEQKSSSATMRASLSTPSPVRTLTRPRSTSDLSSSPASASEHRQPPKTSLMKNEFSISGMIHHLASFSDEDVSKIRLSWPEGYEPPTSKDSTRLNGAFRTSIESENPEMQNNTFHEIYARPLQPLQPPLERPPTPPGMPSWTAAQQRRPRAVVASPAPSDGFHRATARVQRFFGYQPSNRASISTRRALGSASNHGLRRPRDRVPAHRRSLSVPNAAINSVPRFRSQRSGHGVSALEMHPFAFIDTPPRKTRSQEGTTTGRAVTVSAGPSRSVSEPERLRHVKSKGKRKAGQRVRFTLSTSDVNRVPQIPPIGSIREEGARKLTQHCFHRSVSLPNPPPRDVPSSALLDGSSAIQTLPADCLENNLDHLPMSPVLPEVSTQTHCDAAATSLELSLKPRDGKCWKCRIKSAVGKIDEAWESSSLWCCWHCCGIDLWHIDGEATARARLRNEVWD